MPIVACLGSSINSYNNDGLKLLTELAMQGRFICPSCGGPMIYYDTVSERSIKDMGVSIRIYRVRCRNSCHTLRVLPDFLEPYKQYSAEHIESVIKDSEDIKVEAIETKAGLSTVRRWISEYSLLMAEWISRIMAILILDKGIPVHMIESVNIPKSKLLAHLLTTLNPDNLDANILSTSRMAIAAYHGWRVSPKLSLSQT